MIRALAGELPPFGTMGFEFPAVSGKPEDMSEVHILTGVNGTGKTRLLTLLAAMLGNDAGIKQRLKGQPVTTVRASDQPPVEEIKGASGILKRNRRWFDFNVAAHGCGWVGASPIAEWSGTVAAFAYHGAAYVSDANVNVMAGLSKPTRQMCLSFTRAGGNSGPLLQAIANLKMQAAMETMNAPSGEGRATKLMKLVERTVSEVTGQAMYFFMTSYGTPVLRVKWGGADLFFDGLPDGLRSIIGWMVDAVVMMDAWFQGAIDVRQAEAVFLLDEIESHLHPIWQRRVLPAFQSLFPKAQIFVATHSPFVISSLNHGWIHVLNAGKDGVIRARDPMPASKGESYLSVLEDVMGLREWYDVETEELLEKFRTERDRAYRGDAGAKAEAVRLAESISSRSTELRFMMGRELVQMDRRLADAKK